MSETNITNARFELVSSSIKGYKEVQVIFNYQGKDRKYFIFIKEAKNVNYIKEAKKQFNEDVKSGKVIKVLKHSSNSTRPWLIAATSILGVAAITLGGLFIWKALTKVSYNPGDAVEVAPEVVVPAGSTYSVNIENTTAKVGEKYHTDITLGSSNLIGGTECYLPDKLVSVISGSKALKAEEYSYTLSSSKLSATLDIEGQYVFGPIFVNLVLVTPSEPGPAPTPWYLDTNYLNALTCEDVGILQKVKVNGIDHKVRLIGIDHDEEAGNNSETKKAHTTWEFANFICDENGFSLATFWNDINDGENPCGDYLNSSIRYALMGKGNPVGSYGWYEKGQGERSKKYKKSVIEMLPTDLTQKLKSVKKNIVDFEAPDTYADSICTDELFILSSGEIGDPFDLSETSDKLYAYYSPCSDDTNYPDIRRIKRQIKFKEEEGASTSATEVTESEYKTGTIESLAGYNSTDKPHYSILDNVACGSAYWLRDIAYNYEYSSDAYPTCISSSGLSCYSQHGHGNQLATPVAPAFCL